MPKYTPEQRAQAIQLADKHGPAEASRQTGITTRTINRWRNQEGRTSQDTIQKTQAARDTLAARNAKKREELRSLLLDKAVDMLHRMDEEHIDYRGKDTNKVTFPKAPSGAVKDYSVSVGILLDKYRLEMGEATGRTETVDLATAESRVDVEIRKLTEEHKQRSDDNA